jgi:preprotein translocase subunit SecA
VAQLAPGEDVAVAAAFPVLLRALDGGGVHVVTVPRRRLERWPNG